MPNDVLDHTQHAILLVDDQPANLQVLRDALTDAGYRLFVSTSGEAALRVAQDRHPHLILLDVVMGGINGFETCRRLKAHPDTCDIPVIFITVEGTQKDLVEGFEAGGVDYIIKPVERSEVLVRVQTHLSLYQTARDLEQKNTDLLAANAQLQAEIDRRTEAEDARDQAHAQLNLVSQAEAERWGIEGFCGESQMLRDILSDIREVQNYNTSVLIQGESGTGKELITRAIHFGSDLADKPFIVVNCTAVPRELAESLFFGHVKGAFTGAQTDNKGYFELADGGTLFLDEIGDMPLDLQAKLLRVLEDGQITPVGGEAKQVSVRVLSATHCDLQDQIGQGLFRQDLYYRLARYIVNVPPLRDRLEDIPLLVEHFRQLFAREMGIDPPEFSREAQDQLTQHTYPGNIRELKNAVEFALIRSQGQTVMPEHVYLFDEFEPDTQYVSNAKAVSDPETLILNHIREHGSITNESCRALLDISRRQARYMLEKMHNSGQLVRLGKNRGVHYKHPAEV